MHSLGFIDFAMGHSNYSSELLSVLIIIFFGLVKVTFRLADASCSLSRWQALKLTFFMFANVIQYTSRTNIKFSLLFPSNTSFLCLKAPEDVFTVLFEYCRVSETALQRILESFIPSKLTDRFEDIKKPVVTSLVQVIKL